MARSLNPFQLLTWQMRQYLRNWKFALLVLTLQISKWLAIGALFRMGWIMTDLLLIRLFL